MAPGGGRSSRIKWEICSYVKVKEELGIAEKGSIINDNTRSKPKLVNQQLVSLIFIELIFHCHALSSTA
jgi:hypothetical protein